MSAERDPAYDLGSLLGRDAYKLAQFEALVLSQQPSTQPWTPVTDYSFEARKTIEGIHPQLICDSLVPCTDADILDWGCGPQQILTRLLQEDIVRRGWDVHVDGWDPQLRKDPPPLRTIYDLVICREVLEHLTIRQIADTVKTICTYSANLVYVTTRFANAPTHLLDVDTSDDLDPTHRSMLHQDFLRVLFILEGFKRRVDLEQRIDWKHLGRVLVYERCAA